MTGVLSRRGKARLAAAGGAAAVLAVAAALWLDGGDGGAAGADASNPELVALGAAVYDRHCAACHGASLEGQPDWRRRKPDGLLPAPPHDATGHTWHHSDEALFLMTRDGLAALAGEGYRTDMPAYAGILSDREIWAALAYIKSRWPAEIRRAQARR